MITEPSTGKLVEKVDSIYTLVILAAKRARHLNLDGEPLLENYRGKKVVSRSLEEIANGKISYKKNSTKTYK